MNKKQWIVLGLGVVFFSLSELFPPWLYEDETTSARRSAGYHCVFGQAPEVKPQPEMKRIFSLAPDEEPHAFWIREDPVRLFGQRFALAFFAIGFFHLLHSRKDYTRQVIGWVLVFCGSLFSALYILHTFVALGALTFLP